ncbi:hypothetical protein TNCV_1880841 [Trichonephila clavipes]|nr:hypothetical protein TNCV_1880841 [Trichonephila clavipes]
MQWDHPCTSNAVKMNYSETHELSIPNEEAHRLVGKGHSVEGLAVVGMHKSQAYLSRYLRSQSFPRKKRSKDAIVKQSAPHIHLFTAPLEFTYGMWLFGAPKSNVMFIDHSGHMKR